MQKPGQAGKCLRKILDKAIRNRKKDKKIVSRSGINLKVWCQAVAVLLSQT